MIEKMKKMDKTMAGVEQIVRRAWEDGKEIEIWIREKIPDGSPGKSETEDTIQDLVRGDSGGSTQVELLALADDDNDKPECPGVVGEGDWVRIRKGITIDSGAAAFVMPEAWSPGFEKEESICSKGGQQIIGATGTVTKNTGQRKIEFRTNEGQDRRGTFQCADVTKILACVAGLADGAGPGQEHLVIFSSRGGVIAPEALTKVVLPKSDPVTNFARVGNVCAMDAWVQRSKAAKTPFHGQARR